MLETMCSMGVLYNRIISWKHTQQTNELHIIEMKL